jgi:hypothetical protein
MKASYSLSNADNSQIEKQNSQKKNKTVKRQTKQSNDKQNSQKTNKTVKRKTKQSKTNKTVKDKQNINKGM